MVTQNSCKLVVQVYKYQSKCLKETMAAAEKCEDAYRACIMHVGRLASCIMQCAFHTQQHGKHNKHTKQRYLPELLLGILLRTSLGCMQVLDADDAASPSDDSDLDDQVCLLAQGALR